MKVIIVIILLILHPLRSNGYNPYAPFSQNESLIKIDIKQREISFNSLVDNISCIRLETTNKSSFDYCIKMVQYKDHFYLMARTIAGSKIVIYKNTGEFVKEITFSDALLVSSLVIVPDQQQLWVVSRFKVINKFKLDGTLIGRFNIPFPIVDLIEVNNGNFLVYDGGGNKDIEGYHIALTDFKSIKNLFIKNGSKKKRPTFPQSMYALSDMKNKGVFIFPNYTDTIYFYNPDKEETKPYYHLDFHGDFLTREMYPDGDFSDKDMSDIITKRKYTYFRYSFYQASGKLFFKLVGKQDYFCCIKLADNSLHTFSRLFDNYQPESFNPFIGSDGHCLYFITKEKDIIEHYRKNTCTYPNIKKLLPSLSASSNGWILLSIKIKE